MSPKDYRELKDVQTNILKINLQTKSKENLITVIRYDPVWRDLIKEKNSFSININGYIRKPILRPQPSKFWRIKFLKVRLKIIIETLNLYTQTL